MAFATSKSFMKPEANRKVVTLDEIHDWILQTREIFWNKDDQVEVFEVIGTKDTPSKDLSTIAQAFLKAGSQVNDFDCIFHDLFDCGGDA